MNHRLPLVASTLMVALLLGACASPSTKSNTSASLLAPVTPVAAAAPAPATSPSATAQPAAQSTVASVDLTSKAPAIAMAKAAPSPFVFFDFDSSLINADSQPTVDQHAQLLATNGQMRVQIAGHTDERGGREYNLALGQQRADAVSRALVLLGVNPSRIETVSFGEERPQVEGSDEAAFQKNRRAEVRAAR